MSATLHDKSNAFAGARRTNETLEEINSRFLVPRSSKSNPVKTGGAKAFW